MRAVETSLIKAFTLNAAVINCSVKEEKREDAPKEPMSELGLAMLLVSLRKEFPAANGFLNDAKCFMLGDMVSVQLKSGADVINNLGAPKRFAQMIFERFGEDVGVEFTDSGAPVDDGEVVQYQEELDSGIRNAFADDLRTYNKNQAHSVERDSFRLRLGHCLGNRIFFRVARHTRRQEKDNQFLHYR